jgi:hypothetical protein
MKNRNKNNGFLSIGRLQMWRNILVFSFLKNLFIKLVCAIRGDVFYE